ncbi:hypothetical protein LRS05_03460 [Flavobacterium sp. J372]|uniref:hypothetical protein n=1 Tax=Flavobacterium sp. J372 TaxID=2898436 RepID=UPI00215179B5|nr:hypothetical protein [Flavobacterium sp. J372]MCR5861260.1 hypothetical protein [Flavobacterium sp. J372]
MIYLGVIFTRFVKMKLQYLFIAFVLLASSCRRNLPDVAIPDKEGIDTIPQKPPKLVYEPNMPTPEMYGIVVVGHDTLKVMKTYNDNIVYVQKTVDAYGYKSTLNYREATINLIRKLGDTIKFKQEDFKKYIPREAYGDVIMQSAGIDVAVKKGKIPLMINLCMPDSDYCFFFDVNLRENGAYDIREINENEFEE